MESVFLIGVICAFFVFTIFRMRMAQRKTKRLRYPTEDEFHADAYSDDYLNTMNERVNAMRVRREKTL
jgi:hypothetical protein